MDLKALRITVSCFEILVKVGISGLPVLGLLIRILVSAGSLRGLVISLLLRCERGWCALVNVFLN